MLAFWCANRFLFSGDQLSATLFLGLGIFVSLMDFILSKSTLEV